MSTSRNFTPGTRYLFSVTDNGAEPIRSVWGQRGGDGTHPRYEDNICTATAVYEPAVHDRLRPATVSPPAPGSAVMARPSRSV